MHRPGLGLQGGHGHPGDAGAQDAEVLIDHPSGLPAGPGAKPVPHTRKYTKIGQAHLRHSFTIADPAAHTLLGCFLTPRPVL